MSKEPIGKVALVFRGTREARASSAGSGHRLGALGDALGEVGLEAHSAVYLDEMADDVQTQLLGMDGVLVWVDPLAEGGDRSTLDRVLREVASQGIWVSAHPDTILKMGTKEVLYRTRNLGWGSDCHLYESAAQFRAQLPTRLASGSARVLKQYRGNGGIGVYRVALKSSLPSPAPPTADAIVVTQHARRGSAEREMSLGDFMDRLEKHFEGERPMIDQPLQARLREGMIRSYMVQGEVVGFGKQLIKALLPLPPAGPDSPDAAPGPRVMHDASAPEFQRLRRQLEAEWIPAMQELLDIPTTMLPAIWDADFLYGPATEAGEDTYVLCEINVSAVFPFPDQAIPTLARAVAARIAASSASRS